MCYGHPVNVFKEKSIPNTPTNYRVSGTPSTLCLCPTRTTGLSHHPRNQHWLNSMDSKFMRNPWEIYMQRCALCETLWNCINYILSGAADSGSTRSFAAAIWIPNEFRIQPVLIARMDFYSEMAGRG